LQITFVSIRYFAWLVLSLIHHIEKNDINKKIAVEAVLSSTVHIVLILLRYLSLFDVNETKHSSYKVRLLDVVNHGPSDENLRRIPFVIS